MMDDVDDRKTKIETEIDKKKMGRKLHLAQEIEYVLAMAAKKKKPERTRYCKRDVEEFA